MNIKAWAILTTGLADGYELTKSPARVQAAKENGQTVVNLSSIPDEWHLRTSEGWAYFSRPDGFTQAVTPDEPQYSASESLYQLISAICEANK